MRYLQIAIYRLVDVFVTWQTIDWATRYKNIKEGNIVVDVGGYFGGFALFAARRVGPSGKVICFEPDTRNHQILEKRVSKRSIKNIFLIKKAVSNREGRISLFSNFFLSSVCDDYEKVKSSALLESAEMSTLDNELNRIGIGKVDFLKMNIEGAEIEAIDGARNCLKNVSYVVVSSHKRGGKETIDLIEPVLKSLGFKTKVKSGFRYGLHKKLYARR